MANRIAFITGASRGIGRACAIALSAAGAKVVLATVTNGDAMTATVAGLAPNGTLVFKDWQKNHAPIHWLCYASDRWLTGDHISYMTREEMRERLARSFGESALRAEALIGPIARQLGDAQEPRPGEFDRWLCPRDRIGKPVSPFHRKVDVIRRPNDQGRSAQLA